MGTYSPHPKTVKVISPFCCPGDWMVAVRWLEVPLACSLGGNILNFCMFSVHEQWVIKLCI